MFELLKDYNVKKLQYTVVELRHRIEQLEEANGIKYESPLARRAEQVNALSKEDFETLTDLFAKSKSELDKVNDDEYSKTLVDLFKEIVSLDDPYELMLFKEAVEDRRMKELNDNMAWFMGKMR